MFTVLKWPLHNVIKALSHEWAGVIWGFLPKDASRCECRRWVHVQAGSPSSLTSGVPACSFIDGSVDVDLWTSMCSSNVSPGAGLCGGPGLHRGTGLQLDQEELWRGLSGEGQPHEVLLHQGLWPQGGSFSRWTSRRLRPPSPLAVWDEPNVYDYSCML